MTSIPSAGPRMDSQDLRVRRCRIWPPESKTTLNLINQSWWPNYMSVMALQVTTNSIVCSIASSGLQQRPHQNITGLCEWNPAVTGDQWLKISDPSINDYTEHYSVDRTQILCSFSMFFFFFQALSWHFTENTSLINMNSTICPQTFMTFGYNSKVSCKKGPTRHAYAWQIGPFWQDTLEYIIKM